MSEAQTVPMNGDTDPARVAIRHGEAAALRKQGLTWQEIADRLGYAGPGSAYNAVMPALRRIEQETLADLRDITNARLERVMTALWPKAIAGDVKAAGELRRYIADYRRHNGLDAPLQVHVQMDTDTARAVLVDRLLALRGGDVVDGLVVPNAPAMDTGTVGDVTEEPA